MRLRLAIVAVEYVLGIGDFSTKYFDVEETHGPLAFWEAHEEVREFVLARGLEFTDSSDHAVSL